MVVSGRYLTSQQRSRIRRAYLETYAAEKRSKAIDDLYKKFGELYGVAPEVISEVISDDMRRNPEKYKEQRLLAKKLVKNSPKASAPARTAKRLPPAMGQQQAGRTKPNRAKCRTCGRSVGVDHRGNFSNHVKSGRWCRGGGTPVVKPPRPKGTCRECNEQQGIRETDGRVMSHKCRDGSRCGGSGRTPLEGRGGKYMTLTPVKVIGGGLPGLGKR